MRIQFSTSLDLKTYEAVQKIKKERGITGAGLIRLGIEKILTDNPIEKEILELRETNEKLQKKLRDLAIKEYKRSEKEAEE